MGITYPQLNIKSYKGKIATIHTSLGDMKLVLFEEFAPKTVRNFITLAEDNYYDGTIFHRSIGDFMIQGGDPTGTGMGGESIYGEKFEDEFSEAVYNLRGAVSMANAGPDTNGSQFFIVQNKHVDYPEPALITGGWPEPIAEAYIKGGTPHLDGRHTVFGHLVDQDSLATLDHIAAVETDAMDRPLKDVVIQGIEISEDLITSDGPTFDKHVPVFVNRDHRIRIGDIFDSEVIGLQNYGAFVKFDQNKKGLVHISEIQSGFVKDIREVVKTGQKLRVQVIDIDEYAGKISLSARSLEKNPLLHKAARKHFATDRREHIGFQSLKSELDRWTQEGKGYLKVNQRSRQEKT